MKCVECKKRIDRIKYITTVVCKKAGNISQRYGMFYIQVDRSYVGKKFKVTLEEVIEC